MNVERLNRIIERIRSEPAHFIMADWIESGQFGTNSKKALLELECGTAGCIGGWAETLANADAAKGLYKFPLDYDNEPIHHMSAAADWLGVHDKGSDDWRQLDNLFMMDHEFNMENFDRLEPEERARAAIRAIEIYRDTGSSDWVRALDETGLRDEVERDRCDCCDDDDC